MRRSLAIALLASLSLCGCRMCASCYDYTGPTVGRGEEGLYDPNVRMGSAFASPEEMIVEDPIEVGESLVGTSAWEGEDAESAMTDPATAIPDSKSMNRAPSIAPALHTQEAYPTMRQPSPNRGTSYYVN